MTSPTGPDRDRLRAPDAGQETCPFHVDGLPCPYGHGPAAQQPPAQEREVGTWEDFETGAGDEQGPCDPDSAGWCERHLHQVTPPPSEADSAGEDRLRRRVAKLVRDHGIGYDDNGRVEPNGELFADRLDDMLRDHLAASSGVRGGDDQARERLADVLALHQSLAGQDVWCVHDGQHWPCATVRAAGGSRLSVSPRARARQLIEQEHDGSKFRSRWIGPGGHVAYGEGVHTVAEADSETTAPRPGMRRAGVQLWMTGTGWVTDKIRGDHL